MEKQKKLNFSLLIIMFIIAMGIYKQYDFENHEFKKIGLVIVYSLTLLLAVYLLLKDYFKRAEK
jgi:hypothetical protein